ncbi:FAD-dependent oxidoreductase [Sutcliffiella horikoshii]|uniref:FAD-dependent oxidoreductase n=1 Tax=Sutcliffiella horikoshii TaxID=79883 RepID=UPI001CC1C1E9|nr:FAD-dependent oxidoreductase [Sutcliffiella horikoshii]UAL47669.1 FAD-dependent oxidoreductase [Sutcliffiella horikoshii]
MPNYSKLPSYPASLWMEQDSADAFSPLTEDISADVTVIGAGITGITAAYLLAKEGLKVALLEARKVIGGTTGFTTAKISSQHGLIYQDLIKQHGQEKARLYYEANQEGLSFIQDSINNLQIDCDFRTLPSFIYATSKEMEQKVEEEANAYLKLGIDGGFAHTEDLALPFPIKNAVMMRDQAQFHPVKYLNGLLRAFTKLGGKVYEDTRATDIQKDSSIVETENGFEVKSKDIIVSTHYPFNDMNRLLLSRLHVERSYALAAKINKGNIPDGIYLSADKPTRSIRSATGPNGEKLLLLGGEGHPTGQNDRDTLTNYEKLADFGARYFDIDEIPYHWSSQDIFSLDRLPYIGPIQSGSENVLIATAYAKWGMTNGTAAACVLKDTILNQENPYTDLFHPSRSEMNYSSAKSFVKENATVAKELIKGKIKRESRSIEELGHDEGGIIQLDGKKVGAYRDKEGTCHILKPTCTHMGCDVVWNDAERSWDCPCHASRFSYKGDVLEGPATKPLKRV